MSELNNNYSLNPNLAEEFAINAYTNDDDKKINKYFRDKSIYLNKEIYIDAVSLNNDKFQWVIQHLDSVVNQHSLVENTILYRGMENIDHLENFQEGELFWDIGYCSTSFDVNIAKNFCNSSTSWLMKIYSFEGTHGGFLGEYSKMPYEIEFLLPRNQNFMIFEINDFNREFKVLKIDEIIDSL